MFTIVLFKEYMRNNTEEMRKKRHSRVRARISGTKSVPRFSVRKTLSGIYAQLIDDAVGVTLVSADWREVDKKRFSKNDSKCAKAVGELLAKKAKDANITQVVFDRSGYAYHGKVQALAEGARSQGLQF